MSKEKKKKNPNTFSFSLKKTDGKIIRDFIDKQSNFSETIRFLITKYVIENGVEDVSGKLNELLFSALEKNVYNLEENKKVNNLDTNENNKDDKKEKLNNEEIQKENLDIEEVPSCYKIN
ncbi:hypothetical protein ACV3RL_15035 [Clostridium perfringens]|uniref:Uncharacterized protein n=1 Tax=Clostridium perfringens E str. JGS1987 TaxID=451755 RepID=B1BVH5_CLOPF|nr:hypothetical protein [Clostridium perfringens]EDT14306.1 conserved hypothetical protein [Clostridium perfringens E str. JGS1987]MCX0402079.1 hypothetical protein [Clostridium perfringens]